MSQTITKLDAARRQLVTAIRLHFDRGDPVSVLSLAANAWEIVDALCCRAGVDSMSVQTRGNITTGASLKHDLVNEPFRNFFKHADRDPDGSVDLPPDGTVDSLLFLAVEDYIRLNQCSPIELQVFQLWYLGCYPQRVTAARLDDIQEAADAIFPGIRDGSRSEQLALGVKAMAAARADDSISGDARTEPGW